MAPSSFVMSVSVDQQSPRETKIIHQWIGIDEPFLLLHLGEVSQSVRDCAVGRNQLPAMDEIILIGHSFPFR